MNYPPSGTTSLVLVSQRVSGETTWTNSPVNIQMDPPQIATEGFSSDSLSERSPEQHIKNVEKSRRANIIFFGIIQNGC